MSAVTDGSPVSSVSSTSPPAAQSARPNTKTDSLRRQKPLDPVSTTQGQAQ